MFLRARRVPERHLYYNKHCTHPKNPDRTSLIRQRGHELTKQQARADKERETMERANDQKLAAAAAEACSELDAERIVEKMQHEAKIEELESATAIRSAELAELAKALKTKVTWTAVARKAKIFQTEREEQQQALEAQREAQQKALETQHEE